MTQDLWQLDKWVSCECILSPRPRSRTVLIDGYPTPNYFVSYRVVFKNKRELGMFILRYSEYCEPLVYQNDFTLAEQLIMWEYFASLSVHRLYCQGPIQH